MHETFKKEFVWVRMKRDIKKYVSHCLECMQVKAKYHHPMRLLHPHEILESKWEFISIEFMLRLPTTP